VTYDCDVKTLMLSAVLAEFQAATQPSLWQSAAPSEIALLAAGGLLTLGILGVFIFVLTRKESK
jgi:hypothetical protein